MSLDDKLNKALAARQLRPKISTKSNQKIILTGPSGDQIRMSQSAMTFSSNEQSSRIYPTLEAGIKAAKIIEPDEFGTRIVVVEKVKDFHQLPMAVGKYIVDDIQKITGGGYEVHLVEKS